MNRVKEFVKKYWNYIIAVCIPWIIVIIHSFVWDSWLMGGGSILHGDAGTVYYEMYMELWNKLHSGGSLFFTWNTGGGTDFLVNAFNYLCSPFTLVIMLMPEKMISDAIQFIMILRWSLQAFTIVWYFSHTANNRFMARRKLMILVISMAYFLSNVIICDLAYLSWGDILILFPLMLLKVERISAGETRKNDRALYIMMAIGYICNWRMMIPVSIFIILWSVLNNSRRYIITVIKDIILALGTGAVVILPCVVVGLNDGNLSYKLSEYAGRTSIPFTDLIQRLFVCDTLLITTNDEPMLYCSVVVMVFVMLYVFIDVPVKEKLVTIVLTALLLLGVVYGSAGVIWQAGIGVNETYHSFAFMLTFMFIYMAMKVIEHLDSIHIWNGIVVLIAGVGGVAYTFFAIVTYLDFYVYMASLLIFIFIVMMTMFFSKRRIKYENLMIVYAVVCILELCSNSVLQFYVYNYYPFDKLYYHKENSVLSGAADIEPGERIASLNVEPNYGLVVDKPYMSGRLEFTGRSMHELCMKLGMAGNEDYFEMFGASPLLNNLFNVSYGIGQGDISFSDAEIHGSKDDYSLYKHNRRTEPGFILNDEINDWDYEKDSPFDVQNDFVRKACGVDDIFEDVNPVISCKSITGGTRYEEYLATGITNLNNPHDRRTDEELRISPYDEETGWYRHTFTKMYSGDVVTASFESDGESDYYVCVRSDDNMYTSVNIDGQSIYESVLGSKQSVIHIGKVEKGGLIEILSDGIMDDIQRSVIYYRVASFNEENYNKAYDMMSRSVFNVDRWDDTHVEGTVDAGSSGTLLLSIPAGKGFAVVVDGKKVTPYNIGDALMGIPIEEGEHKLSLEYRTPMFMQGLIISMFSVIIYIVIAYCISNRGKAEDRI